MSESKWKELNAARLLLGVFAISCFRDFLEITLSGEMLLSAFSPFQSLKYYLLHFNSFYLLVYCTLSLILFFFASKKISICTSFQVGALAMTMIWIAPLVDYFSQGNFRMAYPTNPWFVVSNIHQFLNPEFDFRGMTWGMRIEITIAGFAAMAYLLRITRKPFRAIAGGACVIIACLSIGLSVPFLCQLYENGWHFQDDFRLSECNLLHEYSILDSGSSLITLFYTFLCLQLLALAYYLRDKKRFRACLHNFRFTRLLHYLLLFYGGMAFIYFNPPFENTFYDQNFDFLANLFQNPANIFSMAMAGLSIALAFESAVLQNDIYDYRIDMVCSPDRPLASGLFDVGEIKLLSNLFLIFALVIGLCINDTFFFLILIYSLLAFLYSSPPSVCAHIWWRHA